MIHDVIALIVILILTAFISYSVGRSHENDYWQDDLVKSGKAEYYLDKGNVRQWRWKE